MILAVVVGNVVATQKNENFVGKKLMLIQPVDPEGNPAGGELVAVDGVGAGEGDLVVAIAEGGSARQVAKSKNPLAPIDLVIAGIVDRADTEKGTLYL
ncbi:MAG: EutN/CcmL family microcompartment protein [Firmicutes bacterium]|nr:EutN/CcmL family microcompartment protein [Bacillota bacterium]